MQHVNRLANVRCLVRNLSSEATRAAGGVTVERIKQEPKGVFGTLSDSGRANLARRVIERDNTKDGSGYDELEYDLEPRKNAYYYKYEITRNARLGSLGLRRALELYQEMKAKARIQPALENFSPLIYGCAKAGFTRRAFDLYDECLKYHGKPTNSIVTCLINSCAESPFPEYGLQRLDWFLKHIKVEFNKDLNEIQYNSAIKAYGKLGRLDEASRLVQEMVDNNVRPSIETFNMLLIGCASNKEAGCSLALRVYKRIKVYDIKPDEFTYKLLLRCIRDCDMGPPHLVKATIDELPAVVSFNQRLEYQQRSKRRHSRSTRPPSFVWAPLLSDMGKTFSEAVSVPEQKGLTVAAEKAGKSQANGRQDGSETTTNVSSPRGTQATELLPASTDQSPEMLPNLLSSDHFHLMARIESIQFDKLKTSSDRLLLFGGLHGYLVAMMKDNCKPDNKTFSLLLDCLVPTRENYLMYHKLAEEMDIKRDLVYYDLLIKHMCTRMLERIRLELALQFVEKMQIDNLRPNISTFEALAGGCDTWKQARRLIEDLEKCGFIASEVIIARFFEVAISRYRFGYLIDLINYCKEVKFSPNKLLVDKLESLRLRVQAVLLNQERSPDVERPMSERNIQLFDEFRARLGTWLKRVAVKEDEHPWAQFHVDRQAKNADFRAYSKQMSLADKAKREALEKGEELGNLYEKSRKLVAEAQ